ncbi:hypothetical protein LQV63_30825 [Paenibacillus profundus]|uniref:Uncharacterized protein n=1 Tax=Paenibacillus profundus TaxID=1173085 RepID=A0ABS8YR18_9BACL|nr:hypothetical protein [Paenibacillus profundus]MCE5173624.1 hypothetical protein [Paenibacillus profundus]
MYHLDEMRWLMERAVPFTEEELILEVPSEIRRRRNGDAGVCARQVDSGEGLAVLLGAFKVPEGGYRVTFTLVATTIRSKSGTTRGVKITGRRWCSGRPIAIRPGAVIRRRNPILFNGTEKTDGEPPIEAVDVA